MRPRIQTSTRLHNPDWPGAGHSDPGIAMANFLRIRCPIGGSIVHHQDLSFQLEVVQGARASRTAFSITASSLWAGKMSDNGSAKTEPPCPGLGKYPERKSWLGIPVESGVANRTYGGGSLPRRKRLMEGFWVETSRSGTLNPRYLQEFFGPVCPTVEIKIGTRNINSLVFKCYGTKAPG